MKKTILSLLLLTLSLGASAQLTSQGAGGFSFSEDRVYYGLRIGLMCSHITADDPLLDVSKLKTGFNFGGVVGLRLSEGTPVFIESGLSYSNRGGKRSKDYEIKTSINTLEVPLLIKYGIALPNDMAVLPFAGAFATMGMGKGHYRNYTSQDYGRAISKHRYQRFDGGLKVGCGFEYRMLYAELGYAFGLSNMVHESSSYESGHAGGLLINFGVNF